MSAVTGLWQRTQAIASTLERLHGPERGRNIYRMGHQALAVRYTVTPGSVPYNYNYWTVTGILVPAGGLLRATATLDTHASALSSCYLLMINTSPPTGVVNPFERDGKYPWYPHSYRQPITLDIYQDYGAETTSTTTTLQFWHQANTASVQYNVYETWTRVRWEIWL